MRRFSVLALAAAMVLASAAVALAAPPQILAPHALLIEAETGSILFEKQADDLVAPASLAKLMTVNVVFDQLQLGNISLDDEYVISVNAWRKGGAPSHGSTMYAALHSRVKVEDLLKGVMIQSANDGCIALAEGIAGNETEFVRMMNDRAREIGLTKSYFTNVDGLPDPKMRVTPRELAVMARYIVLNYPDYYKWFGEREFTWNKIRQQNRNPLLGAVEGADGMKTGFTNEAGYNLVGSAVQNGVRLIVVVTGIEECQGPRRRRQEAPGLRLQEFRCPDPVRRRPERGRGQGLWRRAGPRRGRRQRHGQADGAARCQRQDHREDGLHRAGPGAGARGPGDRQSAGLARRRQGPRGAGAGIRKRCRGLDLATRPRCRFGTCDQPVSLRRQTDISRGPTRQRETGGRKRQDK